IDPLRRRAKAAGDRACAAPAAARAAHRRAFDRTLAAHQPRGVPPLAHACRRRHDRADGRAECAQRAQFRRSRAGAGNGPPRSRAAGGAAPARARSPSPVSWRLGANPMIRGTTRLIAHIGYPTHTFKAPLVFNPYFEHAGIDAVVVPMGCEAGPYPAFLKSLFNLTNILGALITMPHKVTTVALLDEATPA